MCAVYLQVWSTKYKSKMEWSKLGAKASLHPRLLSLPHVPRDRGDNKKSGRNGISPPEITTGGE